MIIRAAHEQIEYLGHETHPVAFAYGIPVADPLDMTAELTMWYNGKRTYFVCLQNSYSSTLSILTQEHFVFAIQELMGNKHSYSSRLCCMYAWLLAN